MKRTLYPMQTITLRPDNNGKLRPDTIDSWDYAPITEDEATNPREALRAARALAAEVNPDTDIRTYFRIDPMNPDHADLLNAWKEMVWASWYRFALANDGRAEKARKLDAHSREDMKSVALVSLYAEYAPEMHTALNNALNAMDRYVGTMRQGAREYNPNYNKHNESTSHRPDALNFIPKRSPIDTAVDEAISNMADDVNRDIITLWMDGKSRKETAEILDMAESTVSRRRYRAVAEFLEKLEATDGIVYIFDKLGMDMLDWFDTIGEWTEKARKAKGKK